MKRIETVYALLQAADPGRDATRLDQAGVAARVESAIGFPVSTPPPAQPTHMEAPMVTQESTQFETPTPTPTRRSWRGPAIAFGTALMVLLVAAAGSIGFWIGSTEDAADAPAETMQVIDTFEDRFIAGDIAGLADLYTTGGTWEDPHGTFSGRDAIAQHLEEGVPYVDFTEFERTSVVAGENIVAVEWQARGLSSPDATNLRPFETKIVGVYEMGLADTEIIVRSVLYFDIVELYNGRPLS